MYHNHRAWLRRGAHRRPGAYEERIIDGSVEESFPASDPSSSSQPGSIAAQYTFAKQRSRASDWIVPFAVGVLVAVSVPVPASRFADREEPLARALLAWRRRVDKTLNADRRAERQQKSEKPRLDRPHPSPPRVFNPQGCRPQLESVKRPVAPH